MTPPVTTTQVPHIAQLKSQNTEPGGEGLTCCEVTPLLLVVKLALVLGGSWRRLGSATSAAPSAHTVEGQ